MLKSNLVVGPRTCTRSPTEGINITIEESNYMGPPRNNSNNNNNRQDVKWTQNFQGSIDNSQFTEHIPSQQQQEKLIKFKGRNVFSAYIHKSDKRRK